MTRAQQQSWANAFRICIEESKANGRYWQPSEVAEMVVDGYPQLLEEADREIKIDGVMVRLKKFMKPPRKRRTSNLQGSLFPPPIEIAHIPMPEYICIPAAVRERGKRKGPFDWIDYPFCTLREFRVWLKVLRLGIRQDQGSLKYGVHIEKFFAPHMEGREDEFISTIWEELHLEREAQQRGEGAA